MHSAPSEHPVIPGIAAIAPELIDVRRRIHAHPELAFEETLTSDLVAGLLAGWGYDVHRGLGKTSLVGVLREGQGARTLGLRADMDALPIAEATGLPYASRRANKMHACGHDGHTAMLLCAARHLAATRRFSGTLNLIFQPAEENFGGAKAMMDDGLFERFPCDAIFAIHNMPGRAAGDMAFRTGAAMASSDRVTITLRGVGGHGAMPHFARDPMSAAGSIIVALQTIVAREIDAQQSAVITVGSVQAGETFNVIPETVVMKLSVRALNADVRALLAQRIEALAKGQAQSFGIEADVQYDYGYPVLVNHDEPTAFAIDVARRMLGEARVEAQTAPLMGSEDFAYMLEARPGCYAFIGNGVGSKGGCMVHNPGYDFNDDILAIGASYWVRLAEAWLAA
ncbi:hippurate hydolase [Burkholderia pseudomallei]|nr:hippurate hydolase [Burkholderia pseudomallei]CAJ8041522.1 hippurate hydolase [Burkholderia pseudomallei]CAJ9469152.1 hippurate hydolase [Burkholderia pseudomallei]CAK0032595.1 hippurate hydolase [Burkholderia pseudomallei]